MIFLPFFLLFFLLSCASKKESSCPPEWFYSYKEEGVKCGIGTAGPHIKGRSYQLNLAITRAIENIAVQKGVEVSSETKLSAQWTKNTSNVVGQKVIKVFANGVKVKGVIKAVKLCGDNYYVLVCEE